MTTDVQAAPHSGKNIPDNKPVGFSWLAVLRVFLLLWAIVCAEQDIERLVDNAGMMPGVGNKGVFAAWTPASPLGFATVGAVVPGSPAAQAGIQPADHLRFDRSYDYGRRLQAGEHVGLTVVHGGQSRHIVLVAAPARQPVNLWNAVMADAGSALSCLVMVLFGGFFVWRGRGKLTVLVLGAALICYGLASALPQFLLNRPDVFLIAFGFGSLNYGLIPLLFWGFALSFHKDTIAAPRPWEYEVFALYGVVQLGVNAGLGWFLLTLRPLPVIGSGFDASTLVSYVGYIVAFIYMFAGWRRSRRDVQQRYALMLIATAAIVLAQAAAAATNFLTILPDAFKTPLSIIISLLGGVVAPPLFAYAILRHKVLDIGFAVNRTLVYTIISFIILLLFGLAEWGIEKVMPHDWHEQVEANAFVSAGIALCIFLIFHRIRDFVEHHVEKLFFRKWHHKEAELKRFVNEARFILKRDPIIAAYVAAVHTFCDGAEAALYLAGDDGVYRRVHGGLTGQPDTLDADISFLVTLRASQAIVEPDGTATAIALVLPMIHRNEVIGATLVGRKPNGFSYRPDEKEVLAWAAHQIGLDLHALEVERLEQTNAALEAANAELTIKYAGLRDITENFLKMNL